jgi:FkbM family methyltransferase
MAHEFVFTESIRRMWQDKPTPVEQPLIEWARQFQAKDKVALDLGANIGMWAVDMSRHSKQVHAFEPQKAMFGMLELNCAPYGNIETYRVALSNTMGEGTLHKISPCGGGTSLHFIRPRWQEFEEYRAPGYKPPTEITSLCPLDEFKIKNISLVKIDVEGHEKEVVEGGVQTLKNSGWPPIIVEVWKAIWFAQQRGDFFTYMSGLGYTPTLIDWAPDEMHLLERKS